MRTLFAHSQKREESRMLFMAQLHGVKIKTETNTPFIESNLKENVKEDPNAWFKDPKVYAHMSKEEKQKETDRLMGMTKRWAGTKPLGGKQKKRV